MLEALISIAIVALLALVPIATHRGLVKARRAARSAWTRVELALANRHELAARVIELLEGAGGSDPTVLSDLIRARQLVREADRPAARAQAEGDLAAALTRALAASQDAALREQAAAAERDIGSARKVYNEAARDYNFRLQGRLGALVAGVWYSKPLEEFKVRD